MLGLSELKKELFRVRSTLRILNSFIRLKLIAFSVVGQHVAINFSHCQIAQSVERSAVNRVVQGSSPCLAANGGAL